MKWDLYLNYCSPHRDHQIRRMGNKERLRVFNLLINVTVRIYKPRLDSSSFFPFLSLDLMFMLMAIVHDSGFGWTSFRVGFPRRVNLCMKLDTTTTNLHCTVVQSWLADLPASHRWSAYNRLI